MTNSHPITPPPELIEKWANNSASIHRQNGTYKQHEAAIATQAARWGADRELEACCEALARELICDGKHVATDLRTVRRPKPPSLKEQALDSWDRLRNEAWCQEIDFDLDLVRRALEQLPD